MCLESAGRYHGGKEHFMSDCGGCHRGGHHDTIRAEIREMRARRGIAQKDMAGRHLAFQQLILSALEHGRRGAPSFELVQRVITYFNIIWDDADEMMRLAGISHPRAVIDTGSLSPEPTLFANELAASIHYLDGHSLKQIMNIMQKARQNFHKG